MNARRPEPLAPPTLAAITLDADGGGVAAVARLIWRVFTDEWGDRCRLVTLGRADERGSARKTPGLVSRVSFGLDLLGRQIAAEAGWVFFSHLGLSRAQAYVPRRVRQPFVVFLHGIEAWREWNESERQLLDGAAAILANSQHTVDRVRACNPGLGDIAVCPLALLPEDVPGLVTPRGDAGSGPRRPMVLMVGRLDGAERYKGHDEMLAAWPRVVASVPDAELVLVGEGDDRVRLSEIVRARGLEAHVRFTGFVTPAERGALYDRASLFALPSRGEGFGLVYLEAMAHARACLGSVHDAAREIIVDGETGYLVDQDDIGQLADRIVAVLADPGRQLEMGRLGRERLLNQFSYARFRARLLAELERGLGEKHADQAAGAVSP